MNVKQLLVLGVSVLASSVSGLSIAEERQPQYVQVAEIEIDPAQLESYKAAVKEHIETAVRVEPAFWSYTPSLKEMPPRTSEFLKSTGMWMRTGRISKPPISRNTKPPPRRWSSRSNLFRRLPSCSVRMRGEQLSPYGATHRPTA